MATNTIINMTQNIDKLIKPIQREGKLLTHEDIDPSVGVKHYHCSTYIDKHNMICLKRNLYGCKQASCNWYLHLRQGLLACDF